MGLRFNMLLADVGISPSDVRLLRHQTVKDKGRTPYSRWRDDAASFEQYQSTQDGSPRSRARFAGGHWASFVAPYPGATMFVGLYEASFIGPVPEFPQNDQYACRLETVLSEYVGRLFVNWGDTPNSKRAWVQRADRQDKPIVELTRKFQEEVFPGFTKFIRPLSEIETMPYSWKVALHAA